MTFKRVFKNKCARNAASLIAAFTMTMLWAPVNAAGKSKVLVVATGGTIASNGPGQEHISGDELIRRLPDIDSIADVSVEQFSNTGSEYMTPELWKALAMRLNDRFRQRPDIDGIVVTHGTDTMEEGSYFLDLTVGGDRPVVVTGAMRSPRLLSSDGSANLFNAIRVAASKSSKRRGTLVVMSDRIFAAREVSKHHTLQVDAFESPNAGPLGEIAGGEVHFFRPPTRQEGQRAAFPLAADTTLPSVGIVISYAGADGTPIQAFTAAGARGIVVSAFAGWSVSGAQEQAIVEAARKGVIVVMSSRTGAGRVVLDDPVKWKTVLDEKLPVIGAADLNPQKARILLMLALTTTHDANALAELFGRD